MEQAEAKRIVDDYLAHMRWTLQLQEWSINVVFGRLSQDGARSSMAEVVILFEYKRATIRIDADHTDDADELLVNLRHELLHCVLGPFEMYRTACNDQCYETIKNIQECVWHQASELAVGQLERMLDHGFCVQASDMDRTRVSIASALSRAASDLERACWAVLESMPEGVTSEPLTKMREALEAWRRQRAELQPAAEKGPAEQGDCDVQEVCDS